MAVSNVRMPEDLYGKLKEWAKEENRSINDLMVEILAEAARHRQAMQWLEAADRFREKLRAKYGEFPDSTPLLREIREERSNRA